MTDVPEHELLVACLVSAIWDRAGPDAWGGEGSYHAFGLSHRDTIETVLLEHPTFDTALPVLIKRVGCMEHPFPLYGPTDPDIRPEEP